MANYTLVDLLKKGLQYDSSWAIYAYGKGADSKARIGQTQFENGGLLDGMDFIIDGVQLGNAMTAYMDGDEFEVDYDEFYQWLRDEDRLQGYNEECYQDDPGCPACGGVMFGADWPNGKGGGACLICGKEYEWDNDEAEWKEAETA